MTEDIFSFPRPSNKESLLQIQIESVAQSLKKLHTKIEKQSGESWAQLGDFWIYASRYHPQSKTYPGFLTCQLLRSKKAAHISAPNPLGDYVDPNMAYRMQVRYRDGDPVDIECVSEVRRGNSINIASPRNEWGALLNRMLQYARVPRTVIKFPITKEQYRDFEIHYPMIDMIASKILE